MDGTSFALAESRGIKWGQISENTCTSSIRLYWRSIQSMVPSPTVPGGCIYGHIPSTTQMANSTTGVKGDTPDISHILVFQFFEPVLYLDPSVAFPETKELPGYFVGFAKNTGDALTFKILKSDMKAILHRSVVRSAKDSKNQNKRVHIQQNIENTIEHSEKSNKEENMDKTTL